MHYVYFISLDREDVYKGSSSDLRRRWLEHCRGKVESTKRYKNLKLIGCEAYLLKSDAERRERFLKTTEGRRLFKQQYKDVINKYKEDE